MRNKAMLILISTLLQFSTSHAQTTVQTMKRLPDTGQKTSYTATFGEDHDYNINPPYYTTTATTTLDTVTGLMWQKYDGGEMTIESAIIYADTLTLAGYTDWRLPNCHELFSILNLDKANPAHDSVYFGKSLADYWWSSQRQSNDPTKIWTTNAGGGIGNKPKSETISAGGTRRYHTRAVRDVSPPPTIPLHFTTNASSTTTTDLLTNLTWTQLPYADSLTWEQAITTAEALVFAGYTDWRLPNIKELQSINDETINNPSTSPTYFRGYATGHYWSSTSLPNQTTKAWYLDNQYGITSYEAKSNRLSVVFVRGGTTTSTATHETTPNALETQGIASKNFIINIFPNPSTGDFNITSNEIIQQITITNIYGQTIYQAPLNTLSTNIKLSTPGTYFLSVQCQQQVQTKIIIVK